MALYLRQLLSIALIALFAVTSALAEDSVAPPPEPALDEDPARVFRHAFWRQPDAGDQLEAGLRREWHGDSGSVAAWQWFLVFTASAPTLEYLIHDNAFGLIALTGATPMFADPPQWFTFDSANCRFLVHPTGNMVLIWEPDTGRIAATDFGAGLRPAAAEIAAPVSSPQPLSTGRLPSAPPPR